MIRACERGRHRTSLYLYTLDSQVELPLLFASSPRLSVTQSLARLVVMAVGLGWAVNLRRDVSQFSSFVSWVTSCRDFGCSLAEYAPPGSKGL